jgi:SAM-dependent methyltransferase
MPALRALLLLIIMLVTLPWGISHGSEVEKPGMKWPEIDVPFQPSSEGIVSAMLRLGNVASGDLVYDLGCGDGRIVIAAATERGARGVGVDIDPVRIKESNENAAAAGVTHLVSFYVQDFFKTDISRATVMMLYLYPHINLKLRPKLLGELKPGTRIVSNTYNMGEWQEDAKQWVEGYEVYVYIVPANVTGEWRWVWEGRRVSLNITQKFQKVQGSLTIGKETLPITSASLRGDTLAFSVERSVRGTKETVSFAGRVSADTITGESTRTTTRTTTSPWKAARNASTMRPIAE